jgi:hypothetical protein
VSRAIDRHCSGKAFDDRAEVLQRSGILFGERQLLAEQVPAPQLE